MTVNVANELPTIDVGRDEVSRRKALLKNCVVCSLIVGVGNAPEVWFVRRNVTVTEELVETFPKSNGVLLAGCRTTALPVAGL